MRTVVPTVVVTPATAPLRNVQRGDHSAAKQAAPPRGVPR
jgi:hypothetical protein